MSDLHIHQWQQRVLVRRARNTHDRTPYASPQGKTLAILFSVHGTFVTQKQREMYEESEE